MRRMLPLFAGATMLALTACGGNEAADEVPAADTAAPAEEAAPVAMEAATDAAPDAAAAGAQPVAFAQCKTCHSTEPGKNMIGPSLAGVVGRKSGTVAGFAYSKAMLDSGKVWDEATLDTYLTAPLKDVPGTKMAFAGIADPAKRAEVIAYLKTLK